MARARAIKEVVGSSVTVVGGKKPRAIGHVKHVLFAAEGVRVVGFEVERPDLAMMVVRAPLYLALDSVEFGEHEVEVPASARKAWGSAAAKRLGIDWDTTVIWQHMPAASDGGADLGTVRDGLFDPETGELEALGLTGGMVADSALGVRDVAAGLVVGFDGTAVRLKEEAAQVQLSGGAAKAAGTTAAAATIMGGQIADAAADGASELIEGAGRVAGKAVAYGSGAARKAAKSPAGKKAVGWLRALRDEVVDAMGPPEDDD